MRPLNNDQLAKVIIDCKIKIKYKNVDILRELAKNPIIRLRWSIAKNLNLPLFPGLVSDWSPLQLKLIYWLMFYSNIEGAYERPPSRVMNNNKLIDNWLEMKSAEAEDECENNWAKGASKVQKRAADHEEVYYLEN